MKKLLLILISNLIFTLFAIAQTPVSGGIFSSTTWTTAESPYQVTGDVVIFPGASLTIEPGVEVRFAIDTKLELRDGDLFANGTSAAPIIFTVDDANPSAATKWEGIENTSTDSAIVMEFDHVVFEYAKTAIHYGGGINLRLISNAVFRYNDRGVYDGGLGYNWVTISDTEFLENGVGMEGRMSVSNSIFTNNTVGFGNPMTFQNINSGARVTNCQFDNNELAVGTIGQIITIAIINGGTFTNNEIGFNGYWAEIDSTTFSNSTDYAVQVVKGEVQNSVFSQNNLGIALAWNNLDLSVHDNNFVEDNIAMRVDGPGAAVYENNFCSSADTVVLSTTDQPIDLNNNCWCTSDLALIADMIIDAYDDVNLGIASYDNLSGNCLLGLVFPGDANDNGQANAWDILNIGLAYGSTGPTRNGATTAWEGQECTDWATVFSNNVNAKHADANGDGVVDIDDAYVIQTNYNQTHSEVTSYQPTTDATNTFAMYLELPDTLTVGQQVNINVMLADATQPIEDIYGIAFAVEADDDFFEDNSFQVDYSDSWLGDNNSTIGISKEFPDDNRMEFGLVRNDQQGVSGYGKIASFSFVMSEDIIVSINQIENFETLLFEILDVEIISSAGINLEVEPQNSEVVLTSTNEISNKVSTAISIFPNPADEVLNLKYDNLEVEQISIFNSVGQIMFVQQGNLNEISLQNFQSGIYYLEVQTNEGVGVKRFLKK